MTNKFLVYDLLDGGFLDRQQTIRGNDVQNAAVFSKETIKTDETFLQIPLTQRFVDALPFELVDTAPDVPHSEFMDKEAAMAGDFVVLTDMGFYDEKYNSLTNTSRPKIRSFALDYANLYNKGKLQELGTEYITEAAGSTEPIIVPVSKNQQEMLQQLGAFSPEKEPHGFFMEPIGDTRKLESDMPDLGSALDELQNEASEEMQFEQ